MLKGCGVVFVFAIVIIALIAIIANSSDDENGGNDDSPSAEELEEQRKGFHCLSTWDGNHSGLERLIRNRLNDPGSMETIDTRISPVDSSGKHRVILVFTAKNAFGGRVRNTAIGTIDNETCEATLLSIN